MNFLGNMIGKACQVLLPIHEEIYLGNPNSSVAICTLSSISMLKKLSNSKVMENVFLAGRLLSENQGIDSLVQSVIQNSKISTVVICGKEVWGHKAGHALLSLYNNGISTDGRIIDCHSPDPTLTATVHDIEQFQKQITIIDKIGQDDPKEIIRLVQTLT